MNQPITRMIPQLKRKQLITEISRVFSTSFDITGTNDTATYPVDDTTCTAIPRTCVGNS